MVRRPDTESDESSQNITEMPVTAVPQKVKAGNRKPNGEGRSQVWESASRSRHSKAENIQENNSDEGDEEDGEEEEEEEEEGVVEREEEEKDQEDDAEDSSPKGSKRVRLNGRGDGVSAKPPRKRTADISSSLPPRDTDGFLPGSVVRVKLHNFLTYDDVEFRPGPYLNMVLGPNGSGKSSIACALCLGLNCSTKVTGRSRKLGKYVKDGRNDGFIEIELKGRKGEPNYTIQRKLKRGDERTTKFTLNGENVSGNRITECVESFGIQIDNLCSFLPQDKVVKFAAMSPQELLIATENAAGSKNLPRWHATLSGEGKKLKAIGEEIGSLRTNLETQEQRNAALERDVQAYLERKTIERQISLLELILPFKEYLDSREEYNRLRKERERKHAEVIRLQERNKPVKDLKEKLEKQYSECAEERQTHKNIASDSFDNMKRKWKENERLSTESKDISESLVGLKKSERARKDRIASYMKQIQATQRDIDNPPEMEDSSKIKADNRELNDRIHQAKVEKEEAETEIKQFVDEEARQAANISRTDAELKNLENVAYQKLQALQRFHKDTADVVGWLRQNKDRFRMEVFEPPFLTMSVRDQRYCDAVESCINPQQLKTFVFQCQEDYKTFNSLIIDTDQGLGRRVRVFTWFRPDRPELIMPPPMNEQELRSVGFDCYALDLVECPDGLKTFLKLECQMHRTAITLDPDRVDTKVAMDMISRLLPNGKGGSGSFITGRQMNQVNRSRYGQRLPMNLIRDIRPQNFLRFQPVDQEKRRRLGELIAQAMALKSEANVEVERIHGKIRGIEARLADMETKGKGEIKAREDELTRLQKKMAGLRSKLNQLNGKLENEQNQPPIDETRQELRNKLFDVAKHKAKLLADMQKINTGAIQANAMSIRAGLKLLQVGANKAALDRLVKTHDQEFCKAKEEYESVNHTFTKVKKDTKDKLKYSQEMIRQVTDEVREHFKEEVGNEDRIRNQDTEEMRQELSNLKAKLDLNMHTNEGVIKQYENRKRQIEVLRTDLANKEAKRDAHDKTIRETREKWYPALRSLVERLNKKFSDSFERVNCAGEVKIGEADDDYDNWRIDIMVKFRDTEALQLLTKTRQSGGERALTTITYLMSLTELTRTPFSLVDEINQGMDARYERAVHNSLVEVTCRPDSGQYFLITPKLLTGLNYDPRMKVLCVCNGEWLPDENASGDMMAMIDRYVAKTR